MDREDIILGTYTITVLLLWVLMVVVFIIGASSELN